MKGKIMDAENVETVPTLPAPEEPKKKFYRNPKLIASAAAGLIAVTVVAVVKGTRSNSDSDSTPAEDETVETIDT